MGMRAYAAPLHLPEFPTPFRTPAYQDTGFPMRTLVEVQLDKLTHSIRTKPQWWQKVHDEDIVQKWRAEAAEQGVPEALFEFGIKVRHMLTAHATITLCTWSERVHITQNRKMLVNACPCVCCCVTSVPIYSPRRHATPCRTTSHISQAHRERSN